MKTVYICLCLFFGGQAVIANEPHKLLVTGASTVRQPADTFLLQVGVVTMDSNAEKGMKANNERMNAILKALKEVGLEEHEYETGVFQVSPHFSQPPKDIPPGWESSITGYEVRNALSIRTNKLNLAGRLIDAASEAGANLFEQITFVLQDEEPAKEEALIKAVKQARSFASVAAKEAGVALAKIIEININSSHIMPKAYRPERFSMAVAEVSAPISPGDVEVSASVSVTYEMEPAIASKE